MTYFKAVRDRFGTGLWVNNPDVEESLSAIRHGALGCTTNPTFAARMVGSGQLSAELVQQTVASHGDQAPAQLQRLALAQLLPLFHPLWQGNSGSHGWVSIQGDPFAEDDPEAIINEARLDRALGENVIAKIPVTAAGLKAIEVLVAEDCPILATEVFAMAQVIALCELYERVSKHSGKRPILIITHISGIYDEYLASVGAPLGAVSAGCILARREVALLADRGWPIQVMGGGIRHHGHFTEMVGGPNLITVNPRDIEQMVAQPPALVDRFHRATDGETLAELIKIPDFRQAWDYDGLSVEAFEDFGPVRFFRGMFEAGWKKLQASCAGDGK